MAYMRDSTGTRMDGYEVPARQDVSRLSAFQTTYTPLDQVPPILDLNYQKNMVLYGLETHTRATTDTYADMGGVTQTAAINAPAFDRILQNGWILPAGLKLINGTTCQMNVAALLPTAGYTIILDVDRPAAFTNSGPILELSDGTVQNRIVISLGGSYQTSFIVQTGGTVVVNQAIGPIQSWQQGHRRIAITVASGAFTYSDNGALTGSVSSGSAPNPANLTTLKLGGGGFAGWIKRVQIIPTVMSLTAVNNAAAGPAPLACWGDSLTFGTGASPTGNYPFNLRFSRWPTSAVLNGGVGGDTSTQIRARMTVDTIHIPWTTVFWAGRNNFADPATVMADIAAMVAYLGHRRFIVMSVINRADGTESTGSTAYNQIIALNAMLQAAYPLNYFDIRTMLVTASGGTGDAYSMAWSYDGLHLNNTGYAYVAQACGAELRKRGWF